MAADWSDEQHDGEWIGAPSKWSPGRHCRPQDTFLSNPSKRLYIIRKVRTDRFCETEME